MVKAWENRAGDMFYDPNFIVAGARDYARQAQSAVMRTVQQSVMPIFSTMFSDLEHVPRQRIAIKPTITTIPEYRASSSGHLLKQPDILGADRSKYFHSPIVHAKDDNLQLDLKPLRVDDESEEIVMTNKLIQTKYRESSAQTSPWQPDYKVIDGSDPEVLKLDFLKWGEGLPPGDHDVKLIERARMKRSWQKNLPPIGSRSDIDKRRDVIAAMERDEWAFRENEIQDIQNLRMELLEKMLEELMDKTKDRNQKKLEMFCKQKLKEKEEKLKKLKVDSDREMRRLKFNHAGVIMKYRAVNVIDEAIDKKSELYAPLMRHGCHPKRWHQVISEHLKKYKAKFAGVERYETLPNWLKDANKIDELSIKLPGTRLCIRETKWTAPVLKKLHEELKSLRQITKQKCNLRVRIKEKPTQPATPQMEDLEPDDTELAAIMLQSVIRGRAAQILVFAGRDNCRELIQELRSTHGVLNKEQIRVFKQKLNVKYDQREEAFCIANSNKIHEALNRLQGTVVGTLLDFLNKELRRLLDERKAHAIGMMAERERAKREAAEAGRRQCELRRRREHDEMFKQIAKVHQETVDLYLEDIITEGLDFASSEEAKLYVTNLAEKLDEEIYEKDKIIRNDVSEQEELIAELVHHFVLPEVEKQIVRQRIRQKQRVILKSIHAKLFRKIESLPNPNKVDRTNSQLERVIIREVDEDKEFQFRDDLGD